MINHLKKALFKTSKATKFSLALGIATGLTCLGFEPVGSIKPATAQEVLQKIEVLVNDEIISAFDVNQRLGLIVASTGGVSSQEQLDRLREQVLDTMISEKLQMQEARKFELKLPQEQLESIYERIAGSFMQGRGGNGGVADFENYLMQYGASKETLLDQIEAENAWQTLVNGRLGNQVVITEEEVEDSIARLKANQGKFEYRLSEIYFIVDNPSKADEVKETASRIAEQAEVGNFPSLARQFSQSASAAKAGDMGWMSEDNLTPEIYAEVKGMSVGQVTKDPIATPGGYYIMAMMDRRRILSVDPMDVTLNLQQVFWPFNAETKQDDIVALIEKIDTERAKYNSCDAINTFAETVGNNGTVAALGDIPLRQLNVQLRAGIENLSNGQNSKPIATSDGIRVFFVCGRIEPTVRVPTSDEIYNQMHEQRLAMMSRRYLRDLRRDAIIDYR